VITSAQFHPQHCNIIMYSSSRGSIKLGDTRSSALCDVCAKVLEVWSKMCGFRFHHSFSLFCSLGARRCSFEIILLRDCCFNLRCEVTPLASISSFPPQLIRISFASDGRFVISRDYLTLKIWDTHMESRPVKVININESLRSMLCELYESDFIFDKFEIALQASGGGILTGGYGCVLHSQLPLSPRLSLLSHFPSSVSPETDSQFGIKMANWNILLISKLTVHSFTSLMSWCCSLLLFLLLFLQLAEDNHKLRVPNLKRKSYIVLGTMAGIQMTLSLWVHKQLCICIKYNLNHTTPQRRSLGRCQSSSPFPLLALPLLPYASLIVNSEI
jgi:hypothetical protein